MGLAAAEDEEGVGGAKVERAGGREDGQEAAEERWNSRIFDGTIRQESRERRTGILLGKFG